MYIHSPNDHSPTYMVLADRLSCTAVQHLVSLIKTYIIWCARWWKLRHSPRNRNRNDDHCFQSSPQWMWQEVNANRREKWDKIWLRGPQKPHSLNKISDDISYDYVGNRNLNVVCVLNASFSPQIGSQVYPGPIKISSRFGQYKKEKVWSYTSLFLTLCNHINAFSISQLN